MVARAWITDADAWKQLARSVRAATPDALQWDPASANRLAVERVAAFNPGGGAAVDVLDVRIAQLEQVAGRRQAALAAVADREHRAITRHLRYPLLQLAQRNQPRAGHMPGRVLPGFSYIQQERLRFLLEALPHLIDVNARNSCHRGILTGA